MCIVKRFVVSDVLYAEVVAVPEQASGSKDHSEFIPLAGRKKKEILKAKKITTSPKLKEDGLCRRGRLQEVRRGWCESGVECPMVDTKP